MDLDLDLEPILGSGRTGFRLGVLGADEEEGSERRASIAAPSTDEGLRDMAASKRTAGTVKRELRIVILKKVMREKDCIIAM